MTFNLSIGYRFGASASSLLRDTRVRLGITNFTDKEPPVGSGQFGYDPSVYQNLVAGRTWNLEVSKKF